MKIPEESVSALMKLAYTERESQFLYIVATFSGHFLRRHFCEFLRTTRGGADQDFLKKAIASGHVREIPYKRAHFRRYHLSSRAVYSAIGKENSSHRKEARNSKATLKLRILDFVLDNFNEDYLEEETDKVQFFTYQHISRDLLPSRTYQDKHGGSQSTVRYFVDKSPLFLAETGAGSPLPVFTYFEHEYESPTSFAVHLGWYRPLLHALNGQYKFIYVADLMQNFDRAARHFQAVLSETAPVHPPTLLNYFRVKQLWEKRELQKLSDKDFAILNQGERRFSTPEADQLYQRWLKGELSNLKSVTSPQTTPDHSGIFETYLLSA